MSTSFGLKTVSDYYSQLLVPSFDAFAADTSSPCKAITCAIFMWHLLDWVSAQHERELAALGISDSKKLKEHICASCEEFKVISAIANGSKHYELSYATGVTESGVKHGYMRGPLISFGTVSHVFVNFNGSEVTFIAVLRHCLAFWESFLGDQLKLQLKKQVGE